MKGAKHGSTDDAAAHVAGPWFDKFNQPTEDQLIAGLPEASRSLASTLLASLRDELGCETAIQWHGLPWRWAITICPRGSNKPCLFLVCDPRRLVVGVCLSLDSLEQLEIKKLAATTRDAVSHAPAVAESVWLELELAAQSACNDALALARATIKK
jgi:hypothetical protein